MQGNENGETRGHCEPRGSNREGFLVEAMSSWGPGGQEAIDCLGSGRRVSNSRTDHGGKKRKKLWVTRGLECPSGAKHWVYDGSCGQPRRK